jgi:hypothetical protein
MNILAVYPQSIDFRCFIVTIFILLGLDWVHLKWQHFMSGLQPSIDHTSAYPGLRPGLVYGRAVGAAKHIYPLYSEYRIEEGESAGDFSLGMMGLGESGG